MEFPKEGLKRFQVFLDDTHDLDPDSREAVESIIAYAEHMHALQVVLAQQQDFLTTLLKQIQLSIVGAKAQGIIK